MTNYRLLVNIMKKKKIIINQWIQLFGDFLSLQLNNSSASRRSFTFFLSSSRKNYKRPKAYCQIYRPITLLCLCLHPNSSVTLLAHVFPQSNV